MAGYAMRPQLAMAALLLLMIGSSLVFLRARPGERDRVRVTERGVPETETNTVVAVPMPEKAREAEGTGQAHGAERESAKRERAPSAASPDEGSLIAKGDGEDKRAEATADITVADAGTGDAVFDQAMSDFRAGRYGEAQKNFDVVAAAGGGNAPSAALFAAQSVRKDSGCSAAAPRFETVSTTHRGSNVGHEAAWQAADCFRALGQIEDARRNYKLLVDVPGYDERAKLALAEVDQERVASRKAAPASPPKAKAAAAAKPPAAASKPAETKKAAPAKASDAF